MIRLSKIMEELYALAPPEIKEPWDNVGLLVGDENQKIEKVYICLDITSENVNRAIDFGADLIVSHHPLIFKPMYSVTEADVTGGIVRALIKNDISAICMHTNFDKADGGMNDLLAQKLGLESVRKYTPDECVDPMGNKLDEIGRVGSLERPMSMRDFIEYVKKSLSCSAVKYIGNPNEMVQTVALCSGSGGSGIYSAYHSGADIYVTADLNHHHAQTAREIGLNMIDAGHFETENIICEFLSEFFTHRFPDIELMVSESKPFYSSI